MNQMIFLSISKSISMKNILKLHEIVPYIYFKIFFKNFCQKWGLKIKFKKSVFLLLVFSNYISLWC